MSSIDPAELGARPVPSLYNAEVCASLGAPGGELGELVAVDVLAPGSAVDVPTVVVAPCSISFTVCPAKLNGNGMVPRDCAVLLTYGTGLA